SGIASMVIFISTLSFLITTPDTWKVSDRIRSTTFTWSNVASVFTLPYTQYSD
ncbi:DUF417 family protein, partial [Vibrio cholerae]|uniref:DUF417 family protein n=1 Tax=Vibrio cholerae TaxID=666 RepID=UPI0013B032DB